MSDNSLQDLINNNLQEFISIREHLHANPELSFQEYNTAQFISDKLTSFGVEHKTGVAGTGIVGLIKGKNPESKTIALRADMDALPIQEENEIPYKSKNEGVMHACGHDVHSTCLLGTAKLLQETKDNWEGTIKLIFQPGEEKSPGGASLLIKEGVLENPKPDAIFALHVYPNLPYGQVGFKAGQYMASCDEIHITVKGKGGHAALPHQTIDPIIISAQLLVNLQTIISRRHNNVNSPSVLSFGKIAGGEVGNVIPNEVKLEGTLRCMDEDWRAEAIELIKKQTIDLVTAMGGEAVINIPAGYPYLVNDTVLTKKAEQIANNALGEENVKSLSKRMTGEDFSFYTHEVPGCFFRLGTSHNGEFEHPVHNPNFNIHQEAIGVGVRMLYDLATKS